MISIALSSFAGYFENVNEFSADVSEETFYSQDKKLKKYILKIAFPDKVYKEMLFPQLNAGEKYIYDGDVKLTYYPILEEMIEETIDEDENAILKTLKDIKSDNEQIIKIEKNGELEKIIYNDGYEVHFFQYAIVDNLNFPHMIEIYENGYLISKLSLENIAINNEFFFEELKLNE
jgi:outer membrane lipoprotein-sorting protein